MTRHLAIGDIHGCFTALETLAEFVGLRSDDTIVTLGDYVNRGPDSCKVIDWLIRLDQTHRLVPLRGNHEIMMLRGRDDRSERRRWLQVGGDATLRSYSPFASNDPHCDDSGSIADIPETHWEFLGDRLLPYYESDRHIFVHASLQADMSLDEQPDYILYWEKFDDPPRHESGKIMVCGHTSQKSGFPLRNDNAICIDTWACGRGWLSCLDVESGLLWQANQARKTRKFFLDDVA